MSLGRFILNTSRAETTLHQSWKYRANELAHSAADPAAIPVRQEEPPVGVLILRRVGLERRRINIAIARGILLLGKTEETRGAGTGNSQR